VVSSSNPIKKIKREGEKVKHNENFHYDDYVLNCKAHIYPRMGITEFEEEIYSGPVIRECVKYIGENYWKHDGSINGNVLIEAKKYLFNSIVEYTKSIDDRINLFLIEMRLIFDTNVVIIKQALKNKNIEI